MPVHSIGSSGVMTFVSSAANPTSILKVEPGEYCPRITLFIRGLRSCATISFQLLESSPCDSMLGSKAGVDTIQSKSPVCVSITMADPLCPAMRSWANFCKSISSVSSTSAPGRPGSKASSRTVRPCALTSTWRTPASPRSAASKYRSIPLRPTMSDGALPCTSMSRWVSMPT